MTEIGKISRNGKLFIERVNREVEQICPFSSSRHNPNNCGDHCPFFEELDNIYDGEYGNRGRLKSRKISVCGKEIETIEDERE